MSLEHSGCPGNQKESWMGAERLAACHRENGTPVFGKGPVPVLQALCGERIGIDWSLLTLLLSLEGSATILTLGSDLGALSLALTLLVLRLALPEVGALLVQIITQALLLISQLIDHAGNLPALQ